jgi:tetratricopeptide (TPR) repeat protein
MNSYASNYRRFPSRKLLSAIYGITLIFPIAPAISHAAPATQDSGISALISDLSADDAAARRAAVDQLVNIGEPARPAVLKAAQSDDPEIRSQAAQVLLKLPWSEPDDPPDVKKILDQYTTYTPDQLVTDQLQPPQVAPIPRPAPVPSPDNRKDAVVALAELADFHGFDALIRLAREEPSESVRWQIEMALRTTDDGSHLAKLRQIQPRPDDAPMSALCGMAWMAADPTRAKPLLEQAVKAGLASSADDGGELDFIVDRLVDLDTYQKQYDAAADLLRRELKANPATDAQDIPLPLLSLFALHADHGPLAGFDDDYKLAGDSLASPKMQYAMARLAARQNKPDEAAQLRKDAFNASGDSRQLRYDVGKFLADNGWDDEATAEFNAFLAMPPGADQGEATDVNVHFALADLAIRRGDDFEAAEQKKDAMSIMGGGSGTGLAQTDGNGHSWPVTENQIWAEIHWRYVKAALKKGDQAAVDEHLTELLKLQPSDEDIATDIVPLLQQRKQTDAANQLFAAAYKEATGKLAADPTNPTLMNGVAWLDAECNENLPEALKLATSAVAAVPDSAEVIDTLADVNFHLGNAAKAVELESKALSLEPGDKFMTGQLAKFKAGAGKK